MTVKVMYKVHQEKVIFEELEKSHLKKLMIIMYMTLLSLSNK